MEEVSKKIFFCAETKVSRTIGNDFVWQGKYQNYGCIGVLDRPEVKVKKPPVACHRMLEYMTCVLLVDFVSKHGSSKIF